MVRTLQPCKLGRTLTPKQPHMRSHCRARRHRLTPRAKAQETEEKPDLGLGLKAVWYGAEQFGNIIGLTKPRKKERKAPTEQEVMSMHIATVLLRWEVSLAS